MKKRIRTGFYGGSFNPIHNGHIQLAHYLIEHHWVDQLWFVVSPENPLKADADANTAGDRLKQVQTAVEHLPNCTVSMLELELPTPSYTAASLRAAVERYPEREFVLIIGGDNLDVFTKWIDFDWILEHFDVVVYPRPGASNKVPENWNRVTLLTEAPQMDISSSQIRAGRS